MGVSITGVGLATAQGCAADITGGTPPSAPIPMLSGPARFAAMAHAALDDCFGGATPPASTPLFVATCNGAADAWDPESWRASFDFARALEGTPWAGRRLPVASAACASGLHALYLAGRALAAGAPEAVVLAVDIASRPCHDSFETLHLLSEVAEPPPWQPRRAGFTLGEAAVALRLVREDAAAGLRLRGPALGYDLEGDDGLARVLAALAPGAASLVLAQGTGPAAVDRAELDAVRTRIDADVPITTALQHFGHTLGASGLLSAALAALAASTSIPRALALPASHAADGRPLVTSGVASRSTVVVCRALGGACAALAIESGGVPAGGVADARPHALAWQRPAPPPPLRDPLLRALAHAAARNRPAAPPQLLLVRLEAPLAPPADATIGGRLLPSSILEMTPGFVAQLVTRSWGFPGPAICLVAPDESETEVRAIVDACRETGDVRRIDLRGRGTAREVDWDV